MATRKTKWSAKVMQTSDALDLEGGVSKAEHSSRRKAEPYRSAMSMLTFYINRAGKNLSKRQLARLEKAKDELRALYGRAPKHA